MIDGASGCDLQDAAGPAVHAGIGPILCGENLNTPFTRARVIHSPAKEAPYRDGCCDARQAPPHSATTFQAPPHFATTFDVGKKGRIAAVADPLQGLCIPLLLLPSYVGSHAARHSSENCANERDSLTHSGSLLRRVSWIKCQPRVLQGVPVDA
jgi:hypothetical protein